MDWLNGLGRKRMSAEKGIPLVFGVVLLAFAFLALAGAANANAGDRGTEERKSGGMMACMSMGMDEMDGNGDGLCDYCGMKLSECEGMRDNGMHERMMGGMHGRNAGFKEMTAHCVAEMNEHTNENE